MGIAFQKYNISGLGDCVVAESKKNKKNKKKKPDRLAFLANKYDLYQRAVQEPSADNEFMSKLFSMKFNRDAIVMREDFCGTGLLSSTWVEEDPQRKAIGYDLDVETVNWGIENNLSKLDDEQRSRVDLRIANVLDAPKDPVDIVCAMNFSWWIFKQRKELLEYFSSVRSSLNSDGLFILDIYGGKEAYEEMEEEHEKDGFAYIWDQDKVCGVSDEILCHISFHFPDGSKMKRAFTYDWRRYGMRESQEILLDAGFSAVEVYWEGVDEEGEGDGEFTLQSRAENTDAWIAYLVAIP
ncbi:MAG: class I SAM-dependent methyltransferase [Planctomycetota bacterium]|nr:class I SAM-dependent methyltransferase [Planctomycetota bacterium]